MSEEVAVSFKFPNFTSEEKEYVEIMRAIGIKPRLAVDVFLEEHSRFLDLARENGVSESDLKTTILNRIYDLNKSRNIDPDGIGEKFRRTTNCVLGSEAVRDYYLQFSFIAQGKSTIVIYLFSIFLLLHG